MTQAHGHPTGPVVTAEMRALVGSETVPVVYDIERGAIRKFARAIGDPNPIYVEESAAREAGYRGVVAPPTFVRLLVPGPESRPFPEPFQRVLDAGSTYRFEEPLITGDRVTVVSKLADVFEKQGRLGTMLFKVREISYRNQAGIVAAVQRSTIITY
jgi:acyl dehydratase